MRTGDDKEAPPQEEKLHQGTALRADRHARRTVKGAIRTKVISASFIPSFPLLDLVLAASGLGQCVPAPISYATGSDTVWKRGWLRINTSFQGAAERSKRGSSLCPGRKDSWTVVINITQQHFYNYSELNSPLGDSLKPIKIFDLRNVHVLSNQRGRHLLLIFYYYWFYLVCSGEKTREGGMKYTPV